MSLAARLAVALRLGRLGGLGDGADLDGPPELRVEGTLRVGGQFHLGSRPVRSHIAVGPGAELAIGPGVSIAHGAAIAAFERIEIGEGTRIAPYAIVMDSNFHGAPGVQDAHHDCKPVIVGRGCRIGSRVTITRGAVIGDGAEILAGSVVTGPIPAGCCAGGVRARPLGPARSPLARWDGTPAGVPELAARCLGLEGPPDLDLMPPGLLPWSSGPGSLLLRALEERYRVVLDGPALAGVKTLGDLAAALAWTGAGLSGPPGSAPGR